MTEHESHEMRETSIAAYHRVRDAGVLSVQQKQVLSTLATRGVPMSAREIDRAAGVGLVPLGRSLQPTVHHLVKAKAVEEAGKRRCNVTGREVLVYRWTGREPQKVEKKKKRRGLTAAERGAALDALRATWPEIPEEHRGAIETLGRWLAEGAP